MLDEVNVSTIVAAMSEIERLPDLAERVEKILSYEFRDSRNENTMQNLISAMKEAVDADRKGETVLWVKVNWVNFEMSASANGYPKIS